LAAAASASAPPTAPGPATTTNVGSLV
jgi:hypothetical protein